MRYIVGIVLVAFLAWCLWWWVAAAGQRAAWESLLGQQRAMGREAEAQVTIKGFPNRIDTTLMGVVLRDERRGWGWEAPFFQVLMLSYKPNHVIAAFAPEQLLHTPIGPVTMTSEQLQASAVFAAETDLGLERMNIDGKGLLTTGAVRAALPRLLVNGTRQEAARERYDIRLEARDPVLAGLKLERIRGDLTLVFDRPLDRHLADGRLPLLDGAIIRALDLSDGGEAFSVSGEIGVDAAGYAEGDLRLSTSRLEILPQYLEALGLRLDFDPALLALLAQAVSGSGPISLEMVLRNGEIRLGPFGTRIGRAPRLRR